MPIDEKRTDAEIVAEIEDRARMFDGVLSRVDVDRLLTITKRHMSPRQEIRWPPGPRDDWNRSPRPGSDEVEAVREHSGPPSSESDCARCWAPHGDWSGPGVLCAGCKLYAAEVEIERLKGDIRAKDAELVAATAAATMEDSRLTSLCRVTVEKLPVPTVCAHCSRSVNGGCICFWASQCLAPNGKLAVTLRERDREQKRNRELRTALAKLDGGKTT